MEHLRDLFRSGAAQPAQHQELAILLDVMPASWAARIYGPAPSLQTWPQRTRRTDVFCPASNGQRTHVYTASRSAVLLPLGQPAQPMEAQDLPADLRPMLVIFVKIIVLLDGDGSHAYHSLPIASVSGILTDK